MEAADSLHSACATASAHSGGRDSSSRSKPRIDAGIGSPVRRSKATHMDLRSVAAVTPSCWSITETAMQRSDTSASMSEPLR